MTTGPTNAGQTKAGPMDADPMNAASANAAQTSAARAGLLLATSKGMMRAKAVLVLLAALAFAIAPLVTRGFNGFDPNRFPVPQIDPPVTPAGYAFAIWGLIYVWLVVHAAIGVWRHATDAAWDRPRWPLIASLAVGAAWLGVAAVSPLWATVLIWAMLITAVVALFRTPAAEARWTMQAPVAIYAGWLSAASFVSLGLILGGYGVVGSGRTAALIALPLAVWFALAVQWRLQRAPEYGVTVIWALVAVIASNLGQGWLIPAVAGFGIVLVGLVALRAVP